MAQGYCYRDTALASLAANFWLHMPHKHICVALLHPPAPSRSQPLLQQNRTPPPHTHTQKHHPVLTFGTAELLCCSPTWRCTLALLKGLTTGPLPPSPLLLLLTAPGDPPAAAATLLPLLPPAAAAIAAAAACRPATCVGCGAAASAERVVLPSLPPPAATAAVSVAWVWSLTTADQLSPLTAARSARRRSAAVWSMSTSSWRDSP